MTNTNINIFEKEAMCIYKDEYYSVRDNGAILRHSRETGRKRKDDDIWTFGTSIDDKGFYSFGNVKVQQIVATDFWEHLLLLSMSCSIKITTNRTTELKILRG